MPAPTYSLSPSATASRLLCPFHDGAGTLDALMAEIGEDESELLDACLDLRSLVTARADGEACLRHVALVRQHLDGRHHLSFYRLRCWLRRIIRVQVRAHRGEAWQVHELPFDFARVDELVHGALASLAVRDEIPACAQVRFVFATDAAAPSPA